MKFTKNDRVRHRVKSDWGLGQILSVTATEVHVFFVEAGKKDFLLANANLEKVTGQEAQHPILDHLIVNDGGSLTSFKSIRQSIDRFLQIFPKGFYGDDFYDHERGYKEKAHRLAMEHLGKENFESLLASADYAGICKGAMKVANATNLIFPNEKMALNDGLVEPSYQKQFSEALFALLFSDNDPESTFTSFANVLEEIGAAKWPIVSYFPFITHLDRHIFIKPTITKNAAEVCAFDISYRPELNWNTYRLVLRLADHLFKEIAELKPRDMIDVQSFMWSIAPGVYKTS
jgi:hypothetical protein